MKMEAGAPAPLGATWDGGGVNFALFSEHATGVDLCLFDSAGAAHERARLPLAARTGAVWHGYVRGLRPGQLYGFRVDGPFTPERGHRFNKTKLLLDPYARAVGRSPRWHDSLFGYTIGTTEEDLSSNMADSGAHGPLGAVVDGAFDWGNDARPRTPWHETIIYELHVKGFTKLHPGVPEALRGTYAGLASDASIRHLTGLGVTAVELLPIHHSTTEHRLALLGLTNYWGYNTLAFFAPDARFASAPDPLDAVREFKSMVRALHAAGIEVILDVVYNHTAEGNQLGPTLSFRGIDNASYYRPLRGDPRLYEDFSGCGNTLDVRNAPVVDLIVDSLRYWADEMHVDGFRFDLATALARDPHNFEQSAAFFERIRDDRVLSRLKMIAEPWDVGPGGYRVGEFPAPWREWNGKYRDCVRRFWRGDAGQLPEFASRITGSSDIYGRAGRPPHASVNFITSHDGFTLLDLVSYTAKRNEANGEENRDGENNNNSWNCGAEGPTDAPRVLALRERQTRNLLATLFLSLGTPMLQAGDEMGRTQRGNNNAYCQDDELSWIDWRSTPERGALLEFTKRCIRTLRSCRALRRPAHFEGTRRGASPVKDIAWLAPGGGEMSDADWHAPGARCVGVLFASVAPARGRDSDAPRADEDLLLLINASTEAGEFLLPSSHEGDDWVVLIDTSFPSQTEETHAGVTRYSLEERSLALLRRAPRLAGPMDAM